MKITAIPVTVINYKYEKSFYKHGLIIKMKFETKTYYSCENGNIASYISCFAIGFLHKTNKVIHFSNEQWKFRSSNAICFQVILIRQGMQRIWPGSKACIWYKISIIIWRAMKNMNFKNLTSENDGKVDHFPHQVCIIAYEPCRAWPHSGSSTRVDNYRLWSDADLTWPHCFQMNVFYSDTIGKISYIFLSYNIFCSILICHQFLP